MGSNDDYERVNDAIFTAAKNGTWILLKNVHLIPAWLFSFEKRLYRFQTHPDFRLFMTMELNSKVDKLY